MRNTGAGIPFIGWGTQLLLGDIEEEHLYPAGITSTYIYKIESVDRAAPDSSIGYRLVEGNRSPYFPNQMIFPSGQDITIPFDVHTAYLSVPGTHIFDVYFRIYANSGNTCRYGVCPSSERVLSIPLYTQTVHIYNGDETAGVLVPHNPAARHLAVVGPPNPVGAAPPSTSLCSGGNTWNVLDEMDQMWWAGTPASPGLCWED